MFTDESSWSLGTLIGLPVVILVAVLAVTVGVLGLRFEWRNTDRNNRGLGYAFAIGAAAALVVNFGIAAWKFYPYKAEYHQWRQVSGQVVDIEKRLVKSGGGMQEKYVITYEGGNEFGCLDTRCATVEVDDVLTLTCKRAWQFTGTDGYDCNFVSKEERS